jgi:hypothetical protein
MVRKECSGELGILMVPVQPSGLAIPEALLAAASTQQIVTVHHGRQHDFFD